jgi:hypothetical protein
MARKPALVSLSSFISDRKSQISDLRNDLAKIEACKEDFKLPVAEANAIMNRAALYETVKFPNITPAVWGMSEYYRDLGLSVSFEVACDSLKDGAVPAICQFILDLGYNPKATDDHVNEYMVERVYRFSKKIGDVSVKIHFTAAPRAESATCRRVQVGEEVKVVPTYAIECN